LAVQVVGVNKKFEHDEVAALNALSPGAMKLPDGEIEGLALAASLRLGQESKQLSLPIGFRKNGSTSEPGKNPLEDSPASAPADATAARSHSAAQAVSDDGMQWVMIQKSFGPVHFERVGIAYRDNLITGQLDAALSAGGLTMPWTACRSPHPYRASTQLLGKQQRDTKTSTSSRKEIWSSKPWDSRTPAPVF
jgi:hypothetical protein